MGFVDNSVLRYLGNPGEVQLGLGPLRKSPKERALCPRKGPQVGSSVGQYLPGRQVREACRIIRSLATPHPNPSPFCPISPHTQERGAGRVFNHRRVTSQPGGAPGRASAEPLSGSCFPSPLSPSQLPTRLRPLKKKRKKRKILGNRFLLEVKNEPSHRKYQILHLE